MKGMPVLYCSLLGKIQLGLLMIPVITYIWKLKLWERALLLAAGITLFSFVRRGL
jgi:hypothetical protein